MGKERIVTKTNESEKKGKRITETDYNEMITYSLGNSNVKRIKLKLNRRIWYSYEQV